MNPELENIDDFLKEKLTAEENTYQLPNWNAEDGWENYNKKHRTNKFLKPAYWLAAAVLIPAAIFVLFNINNWTGNDSEFQFASAARLVELPNGSKVWLNGNSELVVSDNFAANPTVTILGEAYFEIVGKLQIITGGYTFETENCSFNVRNLQSETDIICNITSGNLTYWARQANNLAVAVNAGNFCKINKNFDLVTIGITDNPNFLAWKTGIIKFENTPLATVAEVLREQYKVEIEFENEQTQYCTISGKFDNENLNTILKTIKQRAEIEKHGKQIMVKGNRCG